MSGVMEYWSVGRSKIEDRESRMVSSDFDFGPELLSSRTVILLSCFASSE